MLSGLQIRCWSNKQRSRHVLNNKYVSSVLHIGKNRSLELNGDVLTKLQSFGFHVIEP